MTVSAIQAPAIGSEEGASSLVRSTPQLPIAFNINFDSMGEALGYPDGLRDPSFFRVFDRIADLAARFAMPLSIFVIGRDLEDPECAARVRDWAQAGHEIGNHTWSHHMNLGVLPKGEIQAEITRAHGAIAEVIGHEPKGFVAPAWSTSEGVMKSLMALGYDYDTSVFPSVFLYPMIAKIAFNHLKDRVRMMRSVSRRDWAFPVTRPWRSYLARADYRPARPGDQAILVMPLPTLSRLHLPYWHTIGFMFGWPSARRALSRLLDRGDCFYYLSHPADFTDLADLPLGYKHSLERLNVPIAEKMRELETVFEIMAASGRPFVTMGELARRLIEELRAEEISPSKKN